MKVKISLLAMLLGLFMFTACGGDDKKGGDKDKEEDTQEEEKVDETTPSFRAQKYLEALETQDWEKAKEFATASSASLIDKKKETAEKEGKEAENREVTIVKEEIDDSTQTTAYVYYKLGDSAKNEKLTMKKENDQWQTSVSKDLNLNGDKKVDEDAGF